MSSVKVAVRVRPFNAREISMNSECIIKMSGTMTKIIDPQTRKDKVYHFDYSYWSHDGFDTDPTTGYMTAKPGSNYTQQTHVFKDMGVDVLNNAWQGYHTCLFAYGQTGSGKSYSIVGYGANKGIIPQACEEIFTRIEEKRKNGDGTAQYNVQVSMLEIYNQCVQDLFVKPAQRIKGGLNVRQKPGGEVYVENLSSVPVNSYAEISRQIDVGTNNRTVGATNMNATSSRAHTIVTIIFKQTFYDKDTGQPLNRKASNINLVDLAGSQRAGSTGAEGSRLKEGANINKSLSVLGKVIQTLAEKASGKGKNIVVPYRQSKLTRILQTNLGGNSKTAMIAALSPASVNYDETLSTLRYANQVKNIKNQATVNQSPQDKLIRQLRDENQKLRQMIEKGTLPSQQNAVVQDTDWKEKNHIMNLNQDPYLSGNIHHVIEDKQQIVGSKNSPDIEIRGLGIKADHCRFDFLNDNHVIIPNEEHDKYQVLVNGTLITQPTPLKNNDRIRFGTHNYFLFVSEGEQADQSIDWQFANDQATQKNVDQFASSNAEQNEELKEKLGEIQNLKEEKQKAQAEMQEKIRKMQEEQKQRQQQLKKQFENKASEAQTSQKKELEQKLKRQLQELQRQKRKMQVDLAQNVQQKRKKALEMELQLRQKQEFERELRDIIIKINQVNEISSSMGKNTYLFEPMLNIEVIQGMRKSNVCCKAFPDRNDTNYFNQLTYSDFLDIYYNIKARWEDFQFDIENQNEGLLEVDPEEEEKDKEIFGMVVSNNWKLIGHSNIYLQGIANLVETQNDLTPIIDNAGKSNGRLKYSIYPKMPKQADQDELLSYDNIQQLKGKIMRIQLRIQEAKGLPQKYSYNTFCKYKWIDQKDQQFETEKQPFNQSPQFGYTKDHDVFVSKFVIDKLWSACLTVNIYGQMNVEKHKKPIAQQNYEKSNARQSQLAGGNQSLQGIQEEQHSILDNHNKKIPESSQEIDKIKKQNEKLRKQLMQMKKVEVSRKSSCCIVF